MNWQIRPLTASDAQAAAALLEMIARRGEVLYKPVTAEDFQTRFLCENRWAFAACDENGTLIGFAHASAKSAFLNGENADNTPLYLTLILVHPEWRRQGVGTALLNAVKAKAAEIGKKNITVTDMNPVHLAWYIPGAPGHDHNNAPGVDENCMGYDFLLKRGFAARVHEQAMYLNLAEYEWNPALDEKAARLAEEGIQVGVWQVGMGEEFDGMCDRVGSEYWRNVLKREIAAWHENRANDDPDLWPDGRKPTGPRPILTAVKDGRIVGFTGPVDKQESGRGWFTGICTDPQAEGKGIGTLLFNLLMKAFVEEGAQFSSLFTGMDNHAQKVYKRAGFKPVAYWAVMSCPVE